MTDRDYMQLALELARKAAGHVSPDPMVGAVIVNNGDIVGKGYYRSYGEPHAEAVAIREAGEKCKGATIYTTLEPCCHHGKNPPCADAIIRAGITRVVSSIADPNPKVNSGGFARLKKAGIEVERGLLAEEATVLNESFLKWVVSRLPFVVVKLAQTLDGRTAQPDGVSKWITGQESRDEVHRLRAEYDAVVVGANTVRLDNPSLTVRNVEGRNPKRIVVGGSSPLPADATLFSDEFKENTILAYSKANASLFEKIDGVSKWEIDGSPDGTLRLIQLLMKAGEQRISSVLVEGGSRLVSSLFVHKLVDKMLVFVAPSLLGCGISSVSDLGFETLRRTIKLELVKYKQFGDDMLVSGYPVWR